MIKQITKAYVRTYTDSGQVVAYVEWIDHNGSKGRTEGEPSNAHMVALMNRATREGVSIKYERW